jgi:hypothetical protein
VRPLVVVAGVVLTALAGSAGALEVLQLDVRHEGQRFYMTAVAEIDAPRDVAFAILTDYEHLELLDSKVLASRVLERPAPNVALVWMRVRGCVAFICKELEQIERVEENAPGEIIVRVLPERSDVKLENARWELAPTEHGTRLSYTLEMEPGSWVPIFGRGSVERQLRTSYRNALTAIEQLARNRAGASP